MPENIAAEQFGRIVFWMNAVTDPFSPMIYRFYEHHKTDNDFLYNFWSEK